MYRFRAAWVPVAALAFWLGVSAGGRVHGADGEALPAGVLARLVPVEAVRANRVLSVAFSPDGKLLAAGDQDWLIHLWDISTRKELRRLAGHENEIVSLGFSPDGKILASGSGDCTVRLWDLATGKQLHRCEGHVGPIDCVVFSPDGQLVASAGMDTTIRFWSTTSGKEERLLRGHDDWVTSLAFAPDGKTVASGGWYGTIRLWERATGKEIRRLGIPQGPVYVLAFAPDGKTVLAASRRKTLRAWTLRSGKEFRTLHEPQVWTQHMVISRDGRVLAAGGRDGMIRSWEIATGQEWRPLGEDDLPIVSLALSPDGALLATGMRNGSVWLWDLAGHAQKQPGAVRLTPKELDALWEDMAVDEGVRPHRSLWTFAHTPQQSIPYLQKHLRQALVASQGIPQLIAQLDDDRYAVREKAMAELEQSGALAELDLRQTLQSKPSLEVRRRVERLLKRLNGQHIGTHPHFIRAGRALKILQQAGTPAARQFLEQLSREAPESWLGHKAKAALDDLVKQPTDRP